MRRLTVPFPCLFPTHFALPIPHPFISCLCPGVNRKHLSSLGSPEAVVVLPLKQSTGTRGSNVGLVTLSTPRSDRKRRCSQPRASRNCSLVQLLSLSLSLGASSQLVQSVLVVFDDSFSQQDEKGEDLESRGSLISFLRLSGGNPEHSRRVRFPQGTIHSLFVSRSTSTFQFSTQIKHCCILSMSMANHRRWSVVMSY